MNWIPIDQYAARSEPPGYWISLAVMGDTVAYTAVRAGTGDGPEILHVERGLPMDKEHPDRKAGFRACARACEEDARRVR